MDPQLAQTAAEKGHDTYSWFQLIAPVMASMAVSAVTAYRTVTNKLAQVDRDRAVETAIRATESESILRAMGEIQTDVRAMRKVLDDLLSRG